MRDPVVALDLDCAIATRARLAASERLREALEHETDGFFRAVLTLLSE